MLSENVSKIDKYVDINEQLLVQPSSIVLEFANAEEERTFRPKEMRLKDSNNQTDACAGQGQICHQHLCIQMQLQDKLLLFFKEMHLQEAWTGVHSCIW